MINKNLTNDEIVDICGAVFDRGMLTVKLYMMVGLPVLCTGTAPLRRIIGETGAGFCYEDDDVDDLLDKLAALRDRSTREGMGRAGSAFVREKYNFEGDARLLASALAQCGSRRRGRSAGASPR